MIPPHSFLFFLILHVFQTSQILIPVNESFLGVGIENVTCAVDVHQWHISSQPEMPVVSQLHDATLSCSSSFDFFSYSGTLYFGVNANRSSTVFVNNDYWGAPPPTITSENALPLLHSSDSTVRNTTTMQDGKQQNATDNRLAQDGDMNVHSSLSEHKIRKENPIELKVCDVAVEIVDLHAVPPDPFLDLVSLTLVEFLNPHFEKVICSYLFPYLGDFLEGAESLVPLVPPTEKITGAIPLRNSSLFRSLVHLVHALPPPVPGATLHARFIDDTSLRISCTFEKGLQVTYHSGDEKNWTVLRILFSAFMKHLPSFLSEFFSVEDKSTVESWATMFSPSSNLSAFLPSMSFLWAPDTLLDLLFHTSLPPHSLVSMDINMKGFYWDENTYACRFSQDSGITISNMRIEGAGELGGTFTNVILPLVINQINEMLDRILQSFPSVKLPVPSDPRKEDGEGEEEEENSSSPDDSLYVSIPVKKPLVQHVPPVRILAGYLMISFIVCIAVVLRGLWMQVNHMFLSSTFEPIGRIRVVVEDLILSLGVCTCLGCFVWSNCTTAATVVLGEDLVVYRFSLRSTVVDLWAAGLNPLALAVALFSGIYPYVKLIGVLYFTAWRCTPKASTLHVLDYLGKLSLLDTFVMLIMVTGLTVHDVVDVVVFPPFYLFLAGTLGSIAMGSYATQCWRRNTIVNARFSNRYAEGDDGTVEEEEEAQQGKEEKWCVSSRNPSSTDPSNLAPEVNEDEDSEGSSEEGSPEEVPAFASMLRRIGKCHLKRGVLMCVASFPVWCFPLVSYRVGGVGPLLTNGLKTFNLYQLSASVDPVCLVVTLFTVLIAPCVYVISPSRVSWLASWCAADALALACVAGLLQLNQFVEFIIGEDLVGVYTAHATLHFSLLPLFLASVYIWWLVVGDLLPCNGLGNPLRRLQHRIAQYGERSANAEETTDLLSP